MTKPTQLVADAMKSVWKEKKYWLLGVLIALTSPLASAIQFFQEDWINNADPTVVINNEPSFKFTGLLRIWMMEHTGWAVVIGIIVALIFLVGLIISVIARAGLTQGVQKGTVLQDSVRKSWAAGKPFFWRLFLKSILIGLGVLIVWIPSVISGYYLREFETTGSLLLLPIVVVAFILTLGVTFIDHMATPLLVMKDVSIIASLKQSWSLLRKHWKAQLSIAILLWITQLGIAIIAAIASTGVIFLVFGASLSALKADNMTVLGLLLGLFVILFTGISLVFQGYLSALQQIVWTRYTGEIDAQPHRLIASKHAGQ